MLFTVEIASSVEVDSVILPLRSWSGVDEDDDDDEDGDAVVESGLDEVSKDLLAFVLVLTVTDV